VTRLEGTYGGPSQQGFGSAVFYENLRDTDDLTQAALSRYKTFVGKLWERFGEAAWMGPVRLFRSTTPEKGILAAPETAASRLKTGPRAFPSNPNTAGVPEM
jgi:hypothetical protein